MADDDEDDDDDGVEQDSLDGEENKFQGEFGWEGFEQTDEVNQVILAPIYLPAPSRTCDVPPCLINHPSFGTTPCFFGGSQRNNDLLLALDQKQKEIHKYDDLLPTNFPLYCLLVILSALHFCEQA
jgi:hypothetical protein